MRLKKEYKSEAFQDRIEVNLANISSSPHDEFRLVKTSYQHFDCELCGHKHCMYQFTIENNQTGKQLNVGSECISHFKNSGIDIDLAMGLLKRIQKTVLSARKLMREEIPKDEYKKLPNPEKRDLTIRYFMKQQAKELLADVARNKAILTQEQINSILDLDMEAELKKAGELRQNRIRLDEAHKLEREFSGVLNDARKNSFKEIPEDVIESFEKKWSELYPYEYGVNPIPAMISRYNTQRKHAAKFGWLASYSGANKTLKDIRKNLLKYGNLTYRQEEYARNLLRQEEVLQFVGQNKSSSFVDSVLRQYNNRGFVSRKQYDAMYRIYNSIKRKQKS